MTMAGLCRLLGVIVLPFVPDSSSATPDDSGGTICDVTTLVAAVTALALVGLAAAVVIYRFWGPGASPADVGDAPVGQH
ncbi:MAG TPA: hypothetical protein VFW65_26065 [Pseudonocardiaceae bacterium]|nr:hypothetical protein [Pseudonocardiaceae bacterium]